MNTIEMEILSNANACPCGGVPRYHVARNRGDTEHLYCSNHRCGRIVPAVGRTVAETVELWNKEIREEQCASHSWFRQPDGTFKCTHCGKTHDHVAEQTAVMDKLTAAILEPVVKGRW